MGADGPYPADQLPRSAGYEPELTDELAPELMLPKGELAPELDLELMLPTDELDEL